jgi:hypothetical protein
MKYAWRVVTREGERTSLSLHLSDDRDGPVVAVLRLMLVEAGYEIEPLPLEDAA